MGKLTIKTKAERSGTVYDGTDLQLRRFEQADQEALPVEAFATKEGVAILLQQQQVILTDLRSMKMERDASLTKIDNLKDEREQLKVSLARSKERQSFLILEIPIAILSGFAINMLTSAPGVTWLGVLLITVAMLAWLRLPIFSRKQTEEVEISHGEDV